MGTTTQITWEQVKELIPETVSLYYVNYNDDLSNQLDILQNAMHEGNNDAVFELIDTCYFDSSDNSSYKKQLITDLESKYAIDENLAKELVEEYDDEINEVLTERDDSDVYKDLMNNTSKQTMFYDTGYYVPADSWKWSQKEIKAERQRVKKALGLRGVSFKEDNAIELMIAQASYGGQLVVYFYDDISDYIIKKDTVKQLQFENASVAIIHTGNGSGDCTELPGTKFKVPFVNENLFLCKTFKYSFTFEVCMMLSNWCESTKVSFIKAKTKRVVNVSGLTEKLNADKKLTEFYEKGSCTAGDMDYTRHRNTTYVNNFPHGNKCLDCGTFWID